MISEFIHLECIDLVDHQSRYMCSLPDPEPFGAEEMIPCGEVIYAFDRANSSADVAIKLFDNFKELCIGDTYQRKDFVQTIVSVLSLNRGDVFKAANITLTDCWGEYVGDLKAIDETIWSVN